ncbi:TPA: NAD(+)/NADH kinase [Candidatus Peregrinibacteria bacterium]|nr:NAD(+)/NADH kinase [Candidatus Peregrinibacteria bacterium]HIQ57449.1 NAD(+)/NADH kinase [Candidatus Gracilibacteria bacterium]
MSSELDNLKNIGVTARHSLSAEGKGEIVKLVKYLFEKQKTVFVTEYIYKILKKIIHKNSTTNSSYNIIENIKILTKKNLKNLDLFIFFGGDGTLLSAVHQFAPDIFSVPIFGINGGNLGFFSSVAKENGTSALDKIFEGKYTKDVRMVAKGELQSEDKSVVETIYSLNEITIHHAGIARLRNLEVELSGEYLTTYKADGLIISTPTGSTAYNLAAGGPIVAPQIKAFVITALAPAGFSQRPIVLPSHKILKISVDSTMRLSIDGQKYTEIKNTQSLVITEYAIPVTFLRLKTERYYKNLREKLGWG